LALRTTDGALIVSVGTVLSTMKSELLPETGALLPDRSLAVSLAMEMPMVPVPEMLLIVTVRTVPVPLSTVTVPMAVPVLTRVTLVAVSARLLLKLSSA